MSRTEVDTKSDHSDASTTLSEFVKARYHGEIPLLGGNPTVGARELGNALRGTASNTQASLYTAATHLADAMRDLAVSNRPYTFQQSASGVPSPINIVDNDYGPMHDASTLSDEKISYILSATNVKTEDIKNYLVLLKVARDGVKKKSNALAIHAMQRQAKVSYAPSVSESDLEQDLEANRSRLASVKELCQFVIGTEGDVDLLQAITHDSYYQGRECNRVLAYIGDAAAKLYAAIEMRRLGRSVSDISNLVTTAQSNNSFRDEGVRIGLADLLRVAQGVDPKAKNVMATCYEAVVGVVYMYKGIEGLHEVNGVMRFYHADSKV